MSRIPEQILQAGCSAYCAEFLNGQGSLGDGIEAAYFAIHDHDDWVKAGPKAWDGECLPPAGTKFEACNRGDGNWRKAEMLFVGKEIGVMRLDSGAEYSFYVNEWEYRPIRTPEQIAAEERETAICEMMEVCSELPCRQSCADLYDAGYRKQVQP